MTERPPQRSRPLADWIRSPELRNGVAVNLISAALLAGLASVAQPIRATLTGEPVNPFYASFGFWAGTVTLLALGLIYLATHEPLINWARKHLNAQVPRWLVKTLLGIGMASAAASLSNVLYLLTGE